MGVPTPGPIPQVFLALIGGVALFFTLLLGTILAFDIAHAGRVYPGVSVAGVDVSGLRPEEAAQRLSQSLTYPVTGNIVFKLGDQVWVARPAELGLYFDSRTSAEVAFSAGRQGNPMERIADQFRAWYTGMDLSLLLVYDQRAAYRYLEGIAAQVNIPTVEASLSINGTDVVVKPGQVGRSVDMQATLASLDAQLRDMKDGLVPVVMVR
jgi:vancomycin resistance protein YoaR